MEYAIVFLPLIASIFGYLGRSINKFFSEIFTMLILTVAAAEAAIGLAIIVIYYRNRGSIRVEDIHEMKG